MSYGALSVSLAIHPVTGYLLIATGALLVLGPVLAVITTPWLEIGALVPWVVCWVLALVALILAVGSML